MNKVKWIKIQIANSQKNLYNGTQNYEKILMKTCAVPSGLYRKTAMGFLKKINQILFIVGSF